MKLLLSVALLLSVVSIRAQQTYTLTCLFTDTAGVVVQDGLASLYVENDSSLVGHEVITVGKVLFTALPPNRYLLQLRCPGYTDATTHIDLSGNRALTMQLGTNKYALTGVEVTASKSAFSYKNGNIKATIEHTPLASIPDPIELLARLPTIQVSGDRENLSVIGKGEPLIYLENQRISLNELSALSVNDIKSIEVINNPSAKYEAAGRAVILITRKVNKTEGSRMEVTETISQKRFIENRAGVNVAVKKGKTEWKTNLQYNHLNRYEGLEGLMNAGGNAFESNYDGTSVGPRRQLLIGAGVYRQLAERDYISLNLSGRLQEETSTIHTNSFARRQTQETVTTNNNTNTNSRPFFQANANYQKWFQGSNSQVFVGGQYARYDINVSSRIFSVDTTTQVQALEARRQTFFVDVGTLRVDIEKAFSNNVKWETGGIWNASTSTTIFDVHYLPTQTDAYTTYDYKERNWAVYSQVSGKIGRMGYTTGLRGEYTRLSGGYRDSSVLSIDRTLLYLFPKINVSIPMDSNQTLAINYSRSIRRPNYANANQVSNYITPFLERTNNVSINPGVMNELTVNYQYKTYSVNAGVFQLDNTISYITEYDPSLQKYRMINRNISTLSGANLSVTIPVSYKLFTSTNQLMASMNKASDARADVSVTKPFYYAYSYNQFKLPRGYTFVLAGWFTTTQYEGIFNTNGKYAVDVSLSKVFFNRLTCTVNAFDIFRSLNNIEGFTVNGIAVSTTYIENVKEFSLALKYTFGTIKDARYKNKEVNENSNRLN